MELQDGITLLQTIEVQHGQVHHMADAIIVTVNDKETQAALNITSATTVTYGQTLTLTS